jgi:hypothetical protein
MAKKGKVKQETIEEEAGLPSNWQPVDVEPIRPSSPSGAPPPPNAMSNYFSGSISPVLQHDAYYVKTIYGTPAIPNNLLFPIGVSGSAGANSAIMSASPSSFGPGSGGSGSGSGGSGGSGGGSGGGGGSVNAQFFTVNGNPDLLAVGMINGIPA